MNDKHIFTELERVYDTHTDAARAMGMAPRHYRRIRAAGCFCRDSQRTLAVLLLAQAYAKPQKEWMQ